MEQAIRNFNKQFAWRPEIMHTEKLPGDSTSKFVVGGMGGSHLGAGLLTLWKPKLNIIIHRDYGLPALSEANEWLYIASSYSGNTEETLDFAKSALRRGYAVATVSIGGRLLQFAKRHRLPHVIIPDTKIQPRSALGFSLLALAKLTGGEKLLRELHTLGSALRPEDFRAAGEKLAKQLADLVPVIYASTENREVAYNWKIKFNETGKIPAFHNVFPELNHNEMTGFDVIKTTKELSRLFHFIFLTDTADHPQVQKRMAVCRKLYEKRGLTVTEVKLKGTSTLQKIFSSLILADWTALYLSKLYRTEAAQVPMVEEFKKLITRTHN